MAYEAYEWADGEAGNTPIVAARLNALEQGVEDASEAAEAPVTWAGVTGKPSTFPPVVGTTATTAKAGNYAPTWADVTGKPTSFAPATHTHVVADVTGLQAIISDLEDRIEALEAAAE